MQRYAKAYAWFTGREEVKVEDLKTILPYLLWHKIQPTSKAVTENPKYANDRIAFVEDLVERVENDYTEMVVNQEGLIKPYSAALSVIRERKIGDRQLNPDEVRTVAKNAIAKLGNTDKPYAAMLASHVAAEYNNSVNGSND